MIESRRVRLSDLFAGVYDWRHVLENYSHGSGIGAEFAIVHNKGDRVSEVVVLEDAYRGAEIVLPVELPEECQLIAIKV